MENGTRTAGHLREGVAEEVRAILARRRLNGAKLASAIGRSEMYVSRRLRGETAFDLDDLERIADVLGVAATDLLPRSAPGSTTTRYGKPAERTPRRAAGAKGPKNRKPDGHPDLRRTERVSRATRP